MELVIKEIQTEADLKLFTSLAKRLGLKTAKLSREDKEDIALTIAIEEGRKTGYVHQSLIMEKLDKIGKKD